MNKRNVKTVAITGATDGIGLETARLLAQSGHNVIVHGRTPAKIDRTVKALSECNPHGKYTGLRADLSSFDQVDYLIRELLQYGHELDVLINNAGVLTTKSPRTAKDLDLRFMVNTIAPFLLWKGVRSKLGREGRVINLSSAAQHPVDLETMAGEGQLSDMAAYSQSKLALTMWSAFFGNNRSQTDPSVIAVNPGSLLGSKMVKDAFGMAGKDLSIGAKILVRLSLEADMDVHSGQYFDNDIGTFGHPHHDALDLKKCSELVDAIELVIAQKRAQ